MFVKAKVEPPQPFPSAEGEAATMLKKWLFSINLILALVLALMLSINDCQKVGALGAQTQTFTSALPLCFWRSNQPAGANWNNLTNVAPGVVNNPYDTGHDLIYSNTWTREVALYQGNGSSGHYAYYGRLLLDWNTTAIAGGTVKSGRIKIYWGTKGHNTVKWSCRFTAFTGNADGTYGLADWLSEIDVNSIGLAEPVLYDSVTTGAWNTYELTQAGIDYINKTGHTAIWLRLSVEALDVEPAWASGQYVFYGLGTSGAQQYAELDLEYSGAPATRIPNVKPNPPKDAGTGDNCTAIEYVTPRNAWSSDNVGFRAVGEDGTHITLNLISDKGIVVDNITDEIRSNGYFYWYPALDGYIGYFRCVEANKNIKSEWGCSLEYVEVGNCVSLAKYLEPEATAWRRDIKDFITASHDVMQFYWISDLAGDELDSVFTISQDGARAKTLLSENVSDLASGYMRCVDPDNYNLISSGYILASMNGVTNDYDGLILNLENPLNSMTHGFYYLSLWNGGSSGFDGSTAYWYCNPDELSIEISGTYTSGSEVTVSLNSALELNLASAMQNTELGLSQTGRTWNWLDSGSGVWQNGKLECRVVAGSDGDYAVELRLSAENYVEHRIWDITVSPTGGGAGGGGGGVDILKTATSWFNKFLKVIHLDSAGGHWLFILILALLECIFFYRKRLILTLLLCVTVGLAMSASWISPWIITVLALVLGYVVFTMLKGHRHAEG